MRLSREKNANTENLRIVHCSAGVGPTGIFIALDHLIREMDTGVLENWGASLLQAPQAPVPGLATKIGDDGDVDAASIEDHNGGRAEKELLAEDVEGGTEIGVKQAVPDEGGVFASDDLIFAKVNQLREQRRYMVQTETQYHFLYEILRKLWVDKYGTSASIVTAEASSDAAPISEQPSSKKPRIAPPIQHT